MRWRRPARTRNGHTLGITLLILSLVHTPLPQPDFHNIRHHDGKGEVCEHHDHLLRWHPGATGARDVAVLHWHWFLPGPPGSDPTPEGSGPAVHAHAPAWQVSTWDDGPRVVAAGAPSRLLTRPAPSPLDHLPLTVPGPALIGFMPDTGAHPPLAFGATFAPGVSLTSLLHRWTC
jgi:hypothetical protein